MSSLPFTTVVVPVDFSDDSAKAIEAGLDRVEDPRGLHIVHVMYPLNFASPGVMYGELTDENRQKTIEAQLRELVDRTGAAGATTAVLAGDPGLKVADYADQVGAELIIVPSHGYHGVKRLLLGSTTERIVRYAHCSVLVLRRSDAD